MGVFPEFAMVQGRFRNIDVNSPLLVMPFCEVHGKGFSMNFHLGCNLLICYNGGLEEKDVWVPKASFSYPMCTL